jgi:hypothetical protein
LSGPSFIEEVFDLTVIHYCHNNKITTSGSILAAQTYYLGDDPLTVSPLFTITSTLGVERCPQAKSYFLKNIETDTWELQATNIAPFIAFDGSTGGLTVFTSDKALARIYTIKWKFEDLDSNSEASSVEVTLDLTVIHYCYNNYITASGTGLAAQTYYLGDDSLTVSPQSVITTAVRVERCPLTYSYYVKNTVTNSWELQLVKSAPFTKFNTLNGDLSIFTSDKAVSRIYSIKWRIEDRNSDSDASFIEEIFDLTVIHYCASNIVSTSNSSLAANTYYIGNDAITVSP